MVFLVFFSNTEIAFASFAKPFGGRILYTKAIEIQMLESTGYVCFVLGETITIKPIGSPMGTPMSYFIPFSVRSKTGNSLRMGQLILGKYGIKTLITCELTYPPWTPATVSLDTITLFGTSR
jgi:hypothetical protein